MTKEERIQAFKQLLGDFVDDIDSLTDNLDDVGFFTAPASTKYHRNWEGGLFDHSYQVALKLVDMTAKMKLRWDDNRSPILVGFLHDICKCDAYIKTMYGSYSYNKKQTLAGHGDKSVILLQSLMRLTEEEILCIRYHMGAYEGENVWSNFGESISRYPNVLWTHTADMYATHVIGV